MYEHLPLGSAIVGLDGGACKVRNSGDFYSCLAQRLQLQNGKGSAARTGYCSTVDGAMAENSFRGQRMLLNHTGTMRAVCMLVR